MAKHSATKGESRSNHSKEVTQRRSREEHVDPDAPIWEWSKDLISAFESCLSQVEEGVSGMEAQGEMTKIREEFMGKLAKMRQAHEMELNSTLARIDEMHGTRPYASVHWRREPAPAVLWRLSVSRCHTRPDPR
ncbi:hypothetical protein ACLB2K_037421 [Fragaria x ananassa]